MFVMIHIAHMPQLPFTKAFITGAAGFVGSNLTDRLLSLKITVVVYDNLSTGLLEFLAQPMVNQRFRFVRGDVLFPQL